MGVGEEPGQDKDLGATAPQSLSVGDRVKFDNGLGFEPRWFTGTVASIYQGAATGYRIKWDDDYVDDSGSPLYIAAELQRLSSDHDDCEAVVSEKGS